MELNLVHRDRRPRFLFVPPAQHTAFGMDGRSQGNVFLAWVAGSWHRACVSGLLFIFPHGARESKRGDLLAQHFAGVAASCCPGLWAQIPGVEAQDGTDLT